MAALSSTMSMNYENMTTAELLDTLASLLPSFILGESQEVMEEKLAIIYRRVHFSKLLNIGMDTVLLVLCLGSLLAANRYCVGLIRQISLWKLVLLCILKLVESICTREENEMPPLPRTICHALQEICNSYNQFFTVFLHNELRNLICKLERQKKELSDFMVRAGIGLLLVTVVVGLDFGIQAILEKVYSSSSAREAINELKPLCLIINILFTILITYFGQQTLVSLRESFEFRQQSRVQNNSSNGNKFIVYVIIVSIVFQWTKIILQIVSESVDAFFKYRWMKCTLSGKTPYEALCCIEDLIADIVIKWHISRIYWPHLLEQIAVNIVMIRKQRSLGQ